MVDILEAASVDGGRRAPVEITSTFATPPLMPWARRQECHDRPCSRRARTNLDGYGNPPLPWSRPHDLLASGPIGSRHSLLPRDVTTGRAAHAAGIGAVWFEGDIYLVSGPGTRKSRNLAQNPAATISVRLEGIDLVLEGEATRVTDQATLEKLAAVYREGGWPAEAAGDAFTAPYSAPSAGPPPWHLYRFTFHTAIGVATAEPNGATRWRFEDLTVPPP